MQKRIYIVDKRDYRMEVASAHKETEFYFTAEKGAYRWAKRGTYYHTYDDFNEAIQYRQSIIERDIKRLEEKLKFAKISLTIDNSFLQTVEL